MSGIKTPVTVNGLGVFSGDVRVASCASAEAAKEVADAINAVAHLPINGSGTRVWPGKVQWFRRIRRRRIVHSVAFGSVVCEDFVCRMATDCFDTEAEAMASVRQTPEVR